MNRINIKPLSVNKVWAGRRFKTPDYKSYEQEMFFRLPSNLLIPKGKLKLVIEFGFSSKASDIDNPVKPFIDILSKKYGFNDKMIYILAIVKTDVKKGEEYIEFEITKI